jgi:Flp pilus assembly protein TadB
MTYLAVAPGGPEDIFESFGLWVFLSVGAVALFGVFLPITTWLEARRKEREAYYKAETMRRVTESSTDGGKASIEYLREVNRMAQFRTIEGLKIGGVIMIAIGIGVVTLLWFVAGHELAACGLVPGLIGVAMLVYVYMLAPRVE